MPIGVVSSSSFMLLGATDKLLLYFEVLGQVHIEVDKAERGFVPQLKILIKKSEYIGCS